MEEKDKKYYSNPSLSKTFGQFSPPIPPSMLAAMKAMKIQEESNEQGTSSSTQNQQNATETQEGNGRSVWHRTHRPSENTTQLMEVTINKEVTMAKRPRLEAEGMEITPNQLAGPAGQASQRP
jgi:hypothetical protein